MHLKAIEIKGFKSLGNIRLVDPNPFTVLVGPNGAGKSNIFEALEFFNFCTFTHPDAAVRDFGGLASVFPATLAGAYTECIEFLFEMKNGSRALKLNIAKGPSNRVFSPIEANFPLQQGLENTVQEGPSTYYNNEFGQLLNFTRLFVGKADLLKRKGADDSKLAIDGSNLEKVLKRIFANQNKKEEIMEILKAFIPGFENLEVITDVRSESLLVYEKDVAKALPKSLVSDGTFNLIAIISALYQSDTPQFLCIEEPENGVNPKVARELVTVIRSICQDFGHHIWLNTHSQSIVSELTPDEVILVDKKDGLTQVKQIKGKNLHGLKMDEALLSNALGGGIPW